MAPTTTNTQPLLPVPLSGAWWASRPLWALVLLAITGVIVLVMGRFEDPKPDDRPAPALWRPLTAAVMVCAGLAVMATSGMVGSNGINWVWPLLPVAGLLGFGVVRMPIGPRSPGIASSDDRSSGGDPEDRSVG